MTDLESLWKKGLETFNELQVELIAKRKRKEITHAEAQYKVEEFWAGALRRAVQDGDIEYGSLMAGQSVGLVNVVRPMQEALDHLVKSAEAELQHIKM